MPFLYAGIGVFALILIGFIAYLIALKPGDVKAIEDYKGVCFAHRGLHNSERPENSMAAFRAAVDAGYGIELDIRLSADGELVVFHDDTLDRVCGRCGRVDSFTTAELRQFRLCGTEEHIPTLSEVLSLVDGRVPLLIEIKEDVGRLEVSTAAAVFLKDYKGRYIIESFNPFAIQNFKKLYPEIPCGILCESYIKKPELRRFSYVLAGAMATNIVCRPNFIAFNHNHKKSFALRLARSLYGVPTVAWTVRSKEESAAAKKAGFDGVIFEDYLE